MPQSPQKDRKMPRVAGVSGDSNKFQESHIITHLPSTVTTRRAHSPIRRAPSNQDLRIEQSAFDNGDDTLQEAAVKDGKFFRASDLANASRTPATMTRKPAFFTANSFTSTPNTPLATPELRRAGSALEVRARSDSRSTTSKRIPRLRDPSPERRIQALPTLKAKPDHVSPSPFVHKSNIAQKEDDSNSVRSIGRGTHRSAPSAALRSTDSPLPARRSSGTLPITMKSPQEPKVAASADALSESSTLRSRRHKDEVENSSTLSPNLLPLSSPQSSVSTSTSTSNQKSDEGDSSVLQPVQINRKILDLEIRTTSLLAVNNQLEKQTRRQAIEMKDLRKRLAHAVQNPGSASLAPLDEDLDFSTRDEEEDNPSEQADSSHASHQVGLLLLEAASIVDRAINRALLLSDQLLEDAHKGLHYRPRESEIGVGIRRVIYDENEDESSVQEAEGHTESQQGAEMSDEGEISGLELQQVLPDG